MEGVQLVLRKHGLQQRRLQFQAPRCEQGDAMQCGSDDDDDDDLMNLLLNYSNKKSHETLRTPKTPTVQHHLNATADPGKRLPQSQTLYERNRWLAEWNKGQGSEQAKQLVSKKGQLKAKGAYHLRERKRVTSTSAESSRQLWH